MKRKNNRKIRRGTYKRKKTVELEEAEQMGGEKLLRKAITVFSKCFSDVFVNFHLSNIPK